MNIRYFIFDTSHGEYTGKIAHARTRHSEAKPARVMSITLNVAGTNALVKVDGADKPWRQDKQLDRVGRSVVRIMDSEDHHAFMHNEFYTPEWQAPEDVI